MEPQSTAKLFIGDWCVDRASGQISRDGRTARVEIRTMRLLLCLAEHPGEVVSIEQLLDRAWSDVTVAPDSVYQAVTSLRRTLGDDAKQPTYIETVPRLGYRLVAAVRPWQDAPRAEASSAQSVKNGDLTSAAPVARAFRLQSKSGYVWSIGAAIGLALIVAALLHTKPANSNPPVLPAIPRQSPNSIAVLPFLDLTEQMNEEPFADGMTEELIDKLSKIPGLQVPAPTSSFYFKGKQIPVADIARTLGVAYVLDGSVRKSGARVRVAARIIRADNGYVVWSETYDRPFDDLLMVQDDIAGDVTKALRSSIEAKPGVAPRLD